MPAANPIYLDLVVVVLFDLFYTIVQSILTESKVLDQEEAVFLIIATHITSLTTIYKQNHVGAQYLRYGHIALSVSLRCTSVRSRCAQQRRPTLRPVDINGLFVSNADSVLRHYHLRVSDINRSSQSIGKHNFSPMTPFKLPVNE